MLLVNNFWQKLYKKLPLILFDTITIPCAWYFAYWLRYNLNPFPEALNNANSLLSLIILIPIQLSCYYYFRIHRGLWRYTSLEDVYRIISATFCATIIFILVLYLTSLFKQIPRSILPLYSTNLIILLCSGRFILRYCWDRQEKSNQIQNKRVLIVGAGRAGEALIRDLQRTKSHLPIGFVDDNPSKIGAEVHGIRVLGNTENLAVLVKEYNIELIFIAMPSACSSSIYKIIEQCLLCNIPFRSLPSRTDLMTERSAKNLYAIKTKEILGDKVLQIAWDKIIPNIRDKVIAITGGGGIIGAELCRQIILLKPYKLLIIDNSEFNLYKIDLELQERFPHFSLDLALVSINDIIGINTLFQKFKPQIVFHTAAFKNVQILDQQISRAIQNNIIGTYHITQASIAINVEKFILISTNECDNPNNAVTMTKRMAEIYCQNLSHRVHTQFITLRCIDVTVLSESVIPVLHQQIQIGEPLTFLNAHLQLNIMTLTEICQSILQAMACSNGGEIFTLNLGNAFKNSHPAKQMKSNIDLKPMEEPVSENINFSNEKLTTTEFKQLLKVKSLYIDWEELIHIIFSLDAACTTHNNTDLKEMLTEITEKFLYSYNQQPV